MSIVSKIHEKIIFKHVYNYFHADKYVSKHQSGFRVGGSTVNQLPFLYHTFSKALDDKKDVHVVFCDVSKAYDKVWHRGLLYKLHKLGISGNLLKWFESYVRKRFSFLRPLLFLVYINDITKLTVV